jgi:hypothetical protein
VSNTIPPPALPEMPCHTPSVVLGSTCLQLLAEGWITSTGLCPRCTTTLKSGPVDAPESLVWSVFRNGKPTEVAQ